MLACSLMECTCCSQALCSMAAWRDLPACPFWAASIELLAVGYATVRHMQGWSQLGSSSSWPHTWRKLELAGEPGLTRTAATRNRCSHGDARVMENCCSRRAAARAVPLFAPCRCSCRAVARRSAARREGDPPAVRYRRRAWWLAIEGGLASGNTHRSRGEMLDCSPTEATVPPSANPLALSLARATRGCSLTTSRCSSANLKMFHEDDAWMGESRDCSPSPRPRRLQTENGRVQQLHEENISE
ncbi:hypothetical protein Dimus_007661 [Dionaea muscipula]